MDGRVTDDVVEIRRRVALILQGGEGDLPTIDRRIVVRDEGPVSIARVGRQACEGIGVGVGIGNARDRGVGVAAGDFPLEAQGGDRHMVGIRDGGAQDGIVVIDEIGRIRRHSGSHGRQRRGRVRREGVVSINREVTAAAVGLYTHGVGGLGDESGQRVSGRGHRHHRPGARRLRLVLQIPSRLTATCHPADEGSVIGDRTYGQAAGLVAGDRPHGKVGDNRARLRTRAEVVTPQEHQVRRTADVRREIRIGHHRIDMHCIATGEVELVGMIVVAGVLQIVGEVVGIHGICG